ncbi:MAG: ferredoxin reductase family protein [Chloroflexi bacterium]|nr:ferredoxin reductase family protein [Chloroflexota bacterium]
MTPVPRLTHRVAVPRTWPIRAVDLAALVLGNGAVIVAMWVRHGGLAELGSVAGAITAAGEIAALIGTYAVLLGLVLMSRSPWLDQVFGPDRLAAIHRWLGFAAVWLIAAHGLLTTVGWGMADGRSVVDEAWTLLTTYPYILMTTVGMGLFIAVAVASMRAARQHLSYETWHGIHLYAYLAIALTFAHEIVLGTDFATDPVARIYWSVLYAVVIGLIVMFRFGAPVRLSLRHQLRVANVVREAPGVVSVYMTGRDLHALAVRAGQYFQWRFLARDGWWRAHPYSISAAPNGAWLRVTAKDLGDDSRSLAALPIGTRVFIEGPYGTLTGERRERRRVLLIAGGIGITPLRALLEELPAGPGDLTLIYRTRRAEEVVFREELETLGRLRHVPIHYLVGRRGVDLTTDPLAPSAIQRLVPDVVMRDVYVCGPDPMMAATAGSLRALGVPSARIHSERFGY